MAHKKLRSPDQPLAWRAVLGLFEFFSSLKLAVVLIFLSAFTLAWATFVESEYGTPAVQFGVYGSLGFELLNLMLAINIFCAAAIRFPWKKHQTGFVITHIGLLTLLFGCLLQRRGGIDAQMPVFEGDLGYRAFTDDHQIRLAVARSGSTSTDKEQIVEIPLEPGPFNWQDYDVLFRPVSASDAPDWEEKSWKDRLGGHVVIGFKNFLRLTSGAVFRLARRSQGVVYDEDGVRVEVLDYYADSEGVDAPLVRLKMSMPRREEMGPDGRKRTRPEAWMPLELHIPPKTLTEFPFGIGTGQRTGGGYVTFRLLGDQAELDAFLKSAPQGETGPSGQAVLSYKGKVHRISIADLKTKSAGERMALGDSGLSVELVKHLDNGAIGIARSTSEDEPGPLSLVAAHGQEAADPAVELRLFDGEDSVGRVILFARQAENNIQAHKAGLYGTYWYYFGKLSAQERMQGGAGKRIDVVQGPDAKLYYRNWDGAKLLAVGPLATGEKVDSFQMPIGQLQMYVDKDKFVPSTEPAKAQQPLPFVAKRAPTEKRPAVKVRLTVDGKAEEFWIGGIPAEPFERPALAGETKKVEGNGRHVTMTFPPVDVFRDVGFQVRLDKFERKLDPGTSQAAHYGSVVDIVARDSPGKDPDGKMLAEDVRIVMNAPIDHYDAKTGRNYRLFQESFGGPWGPETPIYQQHADRAAGRDQFFMSVLTVNVDPGRGVRTAGVVLIGVGIFTMFYMRAYFFKPTSRDRNQQRESEPAKAELVA